MSNPILLKLISVLLCSVSLFVPQVTIAQQPGEKLTWQEIERRINTMEKWVEEAETLRKQGQFQAALEKCQQALPIAQTLQVRKTEGTIFNKMGLIYENLGEHSKALDFYQKALTLAKETKNQINESSILSNLGDFYRSQGQYPKALEFLNNALVITKTIGDRNQESSILNNLGSVYGFLGDIPKALNYQQQALKLAQELGNRAIEAKVINNIGSIYKKQGQYPQALEQYQQSLSLTKQLGDRYTEGAILNNIGSIYQDLKEHEKALSHYEQALIVIQKVGNRSAEAITLNNLGSVSQALNQFPKALMYYQQAATLLKELGDRRSEGTTLQNIGTLLDTQKQPELAIIFYKQAITVYETMRTDNKQLTTQQQDAFTQTVASTYRGLADRLLKQDRILEAQQILDLLKVRELIDYLPSTSQKLLHESTSLPITLGGFGGFGGDMHLGITRGGESSNSQIAILKPEAEILKQYTQLQQSAIEVGRELSQLQKKASQGKLTVLEEKRLQTLDQLQDHLNEQFNQFAKQSDITALTQELRRTQEAVQIGQFDNLRRTLAEKGNAALLYPLILDDRLELILTLPNTVPLRRVVPINRQDLNAAILEFRAALQNPETDPRLTAQQLYQWLIQPLESDLKAAKIQTILYAPDSQLRYIPLTALYDGEQWLTQKYYVNNITASSIDKFTSQPQSQLKILAGAFANPELNYKVSVAGEEQVFKGLPAAGKEVEILSKIPGTVPFVDRAFNLKNIKPRMNGFSVVHLATHASFIPGQPEASFILFGDGSTATLKDIEKWDLQNVDLVVLSACETGIGRQALGKPTLGNGVEILGLGYQFQNRGARATIASLWKVDDNSTQVLMNDFYHALNQGMTKVQALQSAQRSLITNKNSEHLRHPYYWAPFILVGNGL